MRDTFTTLLKGAVGTLPPLYALLFNIDHWAYYFQCFLGATVPVLMGISLILDIKKKVGEELKREREEAQNLEDKLADIIEKELDNNK
jgi:predicted P-loop ATPase/GTPase